MKYKPFDKFVTSIELLKFCSFNSNLPLISQIEILHFSVIPEIVILELVGFGKIEILCIGKDNGELKLTRSLFDEGWLMKWGKSEKSVNYIGFGFISAMFNCLFNAPRNSYKIKELARLCSGDLFSHLIIYKV